jgi:hypothetical protein
MAGVHPGGNGVAPTPLCHWKSHSDDAQAQNFDDFSAVAYHDDANDVWASARYNREYEAQRVALSACNDVMGGDCKVMTQINGYIVVSRTQIGDIYLIAKRSKRDARRAMAEMCAKQDLRCTEIGMFKSTDTYKDFNLQAVINRRHPGNLTSIRRSYSIAARDVRRDDNEGFLATGYPSFAEAEAAALQACRDAEPGGDECEVRFWSGNRIMILYSDETGQAYFETDTSLEAASAAMQSACKKRKISGCRVEQSFDISVRGLDRYPTRIQR